MASLSSFIGTLHNLGWTNVAYVAWYKFSLKNGIRKSFFPARSLPAGSFFYETEKKAGTHAPFPETWRKELLIEADKIKTGKLEYFFSYEHSTGSPPCWFLNPFNGESVSTPHKHWTELGDFDLNAGDIKTIWEPSRFHWIMVLARAYALSNEKHYLNVLNGWMNDWVEQNPLHIGPNWKCGQEASIRVMHLILVTKILGQYEKPNRVLQKLIRLHLQRIRANINYALAQDNNHGTSEAAALYIGSAWLLQNYFKEKNLKRWQDKGRSLLENRLKKLIGRDGTFSQYSMTYHRLVLDTMSWVLWNEKQLNITQRLSEHSIKKTEKALLWMETLTDHQSGDAPNFGSNDGAYICKLHSNDYRDFRPSIRLLKALLGKPLSARHKGKDEALFWLNLSPAYEEQTQDKLFPEHKISHFPEGGLIRINGKRSWLFFHYPKYQFRPSHCDFLHVDLWSNGENILRDSGSYSYNTDGEQFDSSYFSSIESHNTVAFDHKEPISRISRFLYADWPQADEVQTNAEQISCQAKYRFGNAVDHRRSIHYLGDDAWKVTDSFSGNYDTSILRWRLIRASWQIDTDKMSIESNLARIEIRADSVLQFSLKEGIESRYYMQYRKLPVLTVKAGSDTKQIESYIYLK